MASDPSLTPPALTPDITGSGLGDSAQTMDLLAAKKPAGSRRQIAFYPNSNASNKPVKPFSRSAAKRQSVMALGSIEHLQHYFTKTGLAAKTTPSNKLQGQFVPAIGGLSLKTDAPSSLDTIQDFELPPSPVIPESRPQTFPPFVKTYETDPDAFLPGVIDDLVATTRVWELDLSSTADTPCVSPSNSHIDVLGILKTTTRAIRSVRNYVIALPDDSAGTIRNQYRNKIAAGDPVKRNKPRQSAQPDPLSMIRKSALEVLSALRELEERSRVPLTDEVYDAQSDHGSSHGQNPHSRVASPSGVSDDEIDSQAFDPDMSISFIRVQGRYDSIPVWEDEFEQETHVNEEEQETRERWDDKLVLGGGWLYKQDVRLQDLGKERDIVQRYVDLVDDVLFDGQRDGKRGWERARERVAKRDRESRSKGRRVSAGDINSFRFPCERPSSARRVVSMDSLQAMTLTDEDDLPEWAKRSSFTDNVIGRAYALLQALLPEYLRCVLPSPLERTALLRVLSSGQPLCVAYNTGVRRSRKPWGFISVDSIHDIISLEQNAEGVDEKGATGWTFRRTDNLRLWAGALKLRYLLPLIIPSAPGRPDHMTPSSSPARNASPGRGIPSSPSTPTAQRIRFSTNETPIHFDPRLVARREEGWESMLEVTLVRWVTAVVEERRGER
ncbi:hypothetical protein F5J12DRAFT_826596 [Pisolithus orientalis]|uniref:uncharacterized protein n=1 Tax=Pisolithus orientalis TaxID=936130 RepID=UPI002224D923|nr:uncharacterized protein F5J12DRAFT_826596 [Pisolithus orientalis]KAI6008915.1 hypothetical protein F5J12DRAFT_826596 [Pisolithus orientalis]